MAAESPASDRLTELLQAHNERAREYARDMPILRAGAHAASERLAKLARSPASTPPPQRTYVDVVMEAPSRKWAEDVAQHLRSELPNAQINLGPAPGEPAGPATPGFVIRCEVSWPGRAQPSAREAVRDALTALGDVEVKYNDPIDLMVVAPRRYPPGAPPTTPASETEPRAMIECFEPRRPAFRADWTASKQTPRCKHGNPLPSCPRCMQDAG
jgi:hypothetical protein